MFSGCPSVRVCVYASAEAFYYRSPSSTRSSSLRCTSRAQRTVTEYTRFLLNVIGSFYK